MSTFNNQQQNWLPFTQRYDNDYGVNLLVSGSIKARHKTCYTAILFIYSGTINIKIVYLSPGDMFNIESLILSSFFE